MALRFAKSLNVIERVFCYHEVIIELMFDYEIFRRTDVRLPPVGGYTPQKRSVIFS